MEFYKIQHAHTGGKKYPWASGWGPLDSMPFMDPRVLERKRQYWELNPQAPGMVIDPGGTAWSDVIGCGSGIPFYFISGRVLDHLAAENVPLLRTTEMPIALIAAKKLRTQAPPTYHVVEAAPGLHVDWQRMGVPIDQDNVAITNPYPKPWPPPVWLINPASWTGLDLFSYSNWQGPTTLLCTKRIVDLATKFKWTNISFERLADGDSNRLPRLP